MTQQQLEIIEKIEVYLSSPDIEMVKLGATILTSSIPQHLWEDMLKKHSEQQPIVHHSGMYTFSIPASQKWYWSIKVMNRRKKEYIVEIKSPEEHYSSTTSTTVYTTIYTGQSGMNLINNALKQQVFTQNKLKTNKNEQNKINKRNKGCARTTFK